MPKMFGLSPLAVLAGSIAFYFVGFLWYGMLFSEAWMAAEGVTPEQAEGGSPIWMAGGFLITILQVIGLGLAIKWRGATSLMGAVGTALILWFLLALPFTLYAYLYLPAHNSTLLMIDASHLFVGWIAAGAVLALLKAWK
jgi:hypothetical protein